MSFGLAFRGKCCGRVIIGESEILIYEECRYNQICKKMAEGIDCIMALPWQVLLRDECRLSIKYDGVRESAGAEMVLIQGADCFQFPSGASLSCLEEDDGIGAKATALKYSSIGLLHPIQAIRNLD